MSKEQIDDVQAAISMVERREALRTLLCCGVRAAGAEQITERLYGRGGAHGDLCPLCAEACARLPAEAFSAARREPIWEDLDCRAAVVLADIAGTSLRFMLPRDGLLAVDRLQTLTREMYDEETLRLYVTQTNASVLLVHQVGEQVTRLVRGEARVLESEGHAFARWLFTTFPYSGWPEARAARARAAAYLYAMPDPALPF